MAHVLRGVNFGVNLGFVAAKMEGVWVAKRGSTVTSAKFLDS